MSHRNFEFEAREPWLEKCLFLPKVVDELEDLLAPLLPGRANSGECGGRGLPSTTLRHRPPTHSPQCVPSVLIKFHQISLRLFRIGAFGGAFVKAAEGTFQYFLRIRTVRHGRGVVPLHAYACVRQRLPDACSSPDYPRRSLYLRRCLAGHGVPPALI